MQPGDGVAPRSAHPLAPTFLTRRCARGTGAAAPPLPGVGLPLSGPPPFPALGARAPCFAVSSLLWGSEGSKDILRQNRHILTSSMMDMSLFQPPLLRMVWQHPERSAGHCASRLDLRGIALWLPSLKSEETATPDPSLLPLPSRRKRLTSDPIPDILNVT